MDHTDANESPRPRSAALERAVVEVTVAIELVRTGAAERVRLVAPRDTADLPAIALASAQAAGVAFAVDGRPGQRTLTFGPRLTDR